jgi:O-antigen/teichoic acid export membrane protein
MSLKEKLVKGTAWVLAANFVVLVLGFLVRPFIARLLGPAEYGVFALILSTGAMLVAFLSLSLNSAVVYFVARSHEDLEVVGRILSTANIALLAVSLALLLPAYVVVVVVLGVLGAPEFAAAYLIGVGICVLTNVQSVQQGLERFRAYSATMTLSSLLAAVLSLGAAVLTVSPAITAFGRFAGTVLPALAECPRLVKKWAFDRALFSRMWSFAAPAALCGLFSGLIVVVDRYMLQIFRSSADVGFFDISYSLVAAMLPVSAALITTMSPAVTRDSKRMALFYEHFSQANVLVLSLAGGVLFYFSDIIVTLLLGPAYAPASTPLKILSVALPFMALYGMNSAAFLSVGRPLVGALLPVGLTVCSVLFNFALIPSLGGNGAALANFLSYAAVIVVGTAAVVLWYRVRWGRSLRQLALFFLLAASWPLLQAYGFWVKVAVVLVFALLSFALNRALFMEIVRVLKSIVSRFV